MRLTSLLLALASAASVASTWTYHPPTQNIIKHTGQSVGKEVVINGIPHYISKPSKKSTTALLYITDAFGIQLPENRLLADSFARAGFYTIAPDLFDGHPAPVDLNTPGFNITAFINTYTTNVTDPKIAGSIKYLREKLGFKKVALTGYCFGGKYVFRFLAKGKGGDVGFAAHPSLLEKGEIASIVGPASVAAAETDSLLTPDFRKDMEAILKNTTVPYSVALYGGTSHGFGVRANVSDPEQKYAKEAAFFQAVQFFQAWA
ncbi:hypothetical protein HDV00_005372 [Rhizophlyctis rosea]|nr:hypothetical protein HDV00_005372 [Rhizophlyctis rosea]